VQRRTKLKVDVGGDFTSGYLASHYDRRSCDSKYRCAQYEIPLVPT